MLDKYIWDPLSIKACWCPERICRALAFLSERPTCYVQVNIFLAEVIEGDARNVLCEAVDKHHASVLVVGSHGYGAIKRYITHPIVNLSLVSRFGITGTKSTHSLLLWPHIPYSLFSATPLGTYIEEITSVPSKNFSKTVVTCRNSVFMFFTSFWLMHMQGGFGQRKWLLCSSCSLLCDDREKA